ncbi:pentapeptide repeat-containing protein [uncultured Desulfobacter sp.]|uniref:pentapeptide repeat-containing protein n=1 Tax=uncultured Desulfobacter sp. TaxID=240139 RepID=UPI002AA70913|nr:pentapeptide repeat-containing protein [uncultured Desulfobacter sp.]
MLEVKIARDEFVITFDTEQFDLLMKCSGQKDMTEWNAWRKHNPDRPVLLQNSNLEKAYLRGADLHGADFRRANLRGADLSGAKLCDGSRRWADLSGADLREADLCLTDFRGANLLGANFSRAYLYYTNLSWTDLSFADFHDADLWACLYKAVLTSVDLSQANRFVKYFTKRGCQLEGTHERERFFNISPKLKWLPKALSREPELDLIAV